MDGLGGDDALPGRDLFLQEGRLVDELNARVLPGLGVAGAATGVHLTDLTYRPGRQCCAVCQVSATDDAEGLPPLVVSSARDDRLKDVFRKRYSSGRAGGKAVYLPDIKSLFERFPADWQLPPIADFWESDSRSSIMTAAGLEPSRVADLQAEVLSYRPHEACVLRLTDAATRNGGALIAKVLREKDKVVASHKASAAFRQKFHDSRVWTPATFRPRGFPQVLLMEFVGGRSVADTVLNGPPDEAVTAVELAALALTEVHSVPRRLARRASRSIGEALEHARRRTRRASLAAADLADEAFTLLDAAERLLGVARERPTFLHGDYKASQLFVEGGRVALLDLDNARGGDPATDVGNFMADLHRTAVQTGKDAPRELAEVFLNAYVTHSGRRDIERRAKITQVITLVRMGIRNYRQEAHIYPDRTALPGFDLMRDARSCLERL